MAADEPREGVTAQEGGDQALREIKRRPLRRILEILGPGLITGASDDDPSGIGTYAVTGASLGYRLLWMTPVCLPMMASVQYICAKIGMVSGRGLGGVIRQHYPAWVLHPVIWILLIANTINAGADIGAIAAALNLVLPVPVAALIVPTGIVILIVQVFGSYRLITRIFKWLTLALFAYIGSAIFAHPDWGEVLKGTLLPTFSPDRQFVTTFVGVLGTTISPYLFFWQANQEVEEEKSQGKTRLSDRKGATSADLTNAAIDVNVGMFFSQLVMYFIILSSGATLFAAGKTDIKSAADAAAALRPLAGPYAEYLLAIGLIGAGFLAVPVLTGSAGYAMAEAFKWRHGLDEKAHRAKEFYLAIAGSTLAGIAMNFLGINPIDALFWTAVLNGVLAPPLLVVIMLIANNRKIMGDKANSWRMNALGWFTAAVMFAAAAAMFVTL